MDLATFHQQVEQTWAYIEEQLEQQGCDVDCDIQGAVFTLTFPDRSQVVLNKQEPLRELWLASKLGGYHFSLQNGLWQNNEGQTLLNCLSQACEKHGEAVHFDQ